MTTKPDPRIMTKGAVPISEATVADDTAQKVAASRGVSTRELLAVGIPYRVHWGKKKGANILRLGWSVIERDSFVFVSISEAADDGGRFIGSASYTLHNVAPMDGRVDIYVNIEWSTPINLVVDYLVINGPFG